MKLFSKVKDLFAQYYYDNYNPDPAADYEFDRLMVAPEAQTPGVAVWLAQRKEPLSDHSCCVTIKVIRKNKKANKIRMIQHMDRLKEERMDTRLFMERFLDLDGEREPAAGATAPSSVANGSEQHEPRLINASSDLTIVNNTTPSRKTKRPQRSSSRYLRRLSRSLSQSRARSSVSSVASVRPSISSASSASSLLTCFSESTSRFTSHQYQIKSEVEVLSTLRHPNVLQFRTLLESHKEFYIVTEQYTGENLHDFMVQRGGRVETSEAVWAVGQLAAGLEYLHERNIVHRRVDAQNAQFVRRPGGLHLVLTNFSGAEKLAYSRQLLKTAAGVCGPFCYFAPEAVKVCEACSLRALRGSSCSHGHSSTVALAHRHHPRRLRLAGNGKPADVWSLGVVLYALLCKNMPVCAETNGAFLREVCQEQFARFHDETDEIWRGVPAEGRALAREMLALRPRLRPSVQQVRESAWMTLPAQLPTDV